MTEKNLNLWLTAPFKDKEVQLIRAFLDVAQNEGVELVTMQMVAKRAKTAISTVHYYFGKSPRALIDSALRYIARESAEYLTSHLKESQLKSESNLLKTYVQVKFAWLDEFPAYGGMWVFFLYLTTQDVCYREYSEEMRENTEKGIQSLILQEIGKGTYNRRSDLPTLASQVEQIVFGGILIAITSCRDVKARNRIMKQTWEMVRQELTN